MTSLSLREAAREAGASKSTILRAIQSGRLAAAKKDDGGYAIDPAELSRAYPSKAKAVAVRLDQEAPASNETPSGLSLREAARQAGVSKSTILRAIRSGRLSPPKGDDGAYAIDPAELFIVFKPVAKDAAEQCAELVQEEVSVQEGTPADAAVPPGAELAARMTALEAELLGLKKLLAAANRPRESLWKRLVG